ncbi:MAG: TRAM domain-containing protein [Oligoflexia bacterium]|nr:TRAM domain-containing protein [Oligoflexia bacterium]
MQLLITDLSRSGAGIGRDTENRVIFVPYTCPGDLIEVEITNAQKRYAEGRIVKILEPSSLRLTPQCPAFTICGGCDWQHIKYEHQWETKKKGILHSLERTGVNTQDIAFTDFPAEKIWNYRNRIQIRGQENQLGFYKKGTNHIIDIENCAIADLAINNEILNLRKQFPLPRREQKYEIEKTLTGETTVRRNRPHSAMGFRQVHEKQNQVLIQWISERLSTGGDVLLDLFGGSGNLSSNLLSKYKHTYCIDLYTPKQLQEENRIFISAEVSDGLQKIREKIVSHSIDIILDPPREGLGKNQNKILEAIQQLNSKKIVFISCEVDPWSHTLLKLQNRGWAIKELGALDFFPQTRHIESLAVLERINS